MTTNIYYRRMTLTDAQAVSDMVARTFNTFVAPDFEPLGITKFLEFVTPAILKERLLAGSFSLIAQDNDAITGVIEFRDYSHVSLLFVDERYQRMGISRELMRQGIAICQEHNPNIKDITVNSSLYAVEIYQRLGFEIRAPEETHDGIRAVPMWLHLR